MFGRNHLPARNALPYVNGNRLHLDPFRPALVVAVAAGILVGCARPTGQSADPSPSNEPGATATVASAWAEPSAYRFAFTSTCGERSLIGQFEATVENGAVVSFRAQDDAAAAFPGTASDLPTLGDLLRRAQEAQANSEANVELVTDANDGHPARIEIDWLPNAIDDEECYAIESYEVGSPSSS